MYRVRKMFIKDKGTGNFCIRAIFSSQTNFFIIVFSQYFIESNITEPTFEMLYHFVLLMFCVNLNDILANMLLMMQFGFKIASIGQLVIKF